MKEKIPFYNIVNMFFIGAVFSLCLILLFYKAVPFDLLKENSQFLSEWKVLISAVLLIGMYELGFIINRLGAIIIEPVLDSTKIWPKEKYDIDVSEISAKNDKFQAMITELALMRSHIMMYSLLIVISVLQHKCLLSLVFLLLVIVFVLGGRKHNAKINSIRKAYGKKVAANPLVIKHRCRYTSKK